jgi:hypothetical protein
MKGDVMKILAIAEPRLRAMETRGRHFDELEEIKALRAERAELMAAVRHLRAGVEWLAQTVHQAHHTEHGAVCPITCVEASFVVENGRPRQVRVTCTCDAGKRWTDCRRGTCPSVRHVLGDGDLTAGGNHGR